MRKDIVLSTIICAVCLCWIGSAFADVPDTSWTRTFGGSNNDWGMDVQQTADRGFIVVGYTYSYDGTFYESEDFDIYPTSKGLEPPPYEPLDGKGNWSSYGWSVLHDEIPFDSNYVMVRNHGVGSGNYATYHLHASENITSLTVGFRYFDQRNCDLFVKVSSDNSSWSNVTSQYELHDTPSPTDVVADLTSHISGYGQDAYVRFETNYWSGNYWMNAIDDFWITGVSARTYLVKTGVNGGIEWEETYGDEYGCYGHAVQQTTDGGFVATGMIYTEDSLSNVYLLKTDDDGNEEWMKSFGGTNRDYGYSVLQTTDGGFIIAGVTYSFGAGQADAYLVKTDANGNKMWETTYGDSQNDYGYSVIQTSEGGYAIAGWTESFGAGTTDAWLIKTNATGNKTWDFPYGGSLYHKGYAVQQTADNGYIITGKRLLDDGRADEVLLVKTNSSGGTQWIKKIGTPHGDGGRSVELTSDGGYIITGWTHTHENSGNFYIVKTDANGDTLWTKSLGAVPVDEGYSIKETFDGGYVAVGVTKSYGNGEYDIWLVRIGERIGTICGWVTDQYNGQPIADVILDLYNASGDTLFVSAATDNDGYYEFSYYVADSDTHWLIVGEEYNVWMVLPEGYCTHDVSSKEAIVPDTVNFTAYVQGGSYARSMGYWKHQVNTVLKGKVHDYTEADLLGFLDALHTTWEYFDDVLTLEDMKDVFTVNKNGTMAARAARQVLALELNVVSGKVNEGAATDLGDLSAASTVGEAIQECEDILLDPNSTDEDYERAKDIAEMLNNMEGYVGGGPQAYGTRAHGAPFSLEQNYPNPFTDVTTIPYAVYERASVSIRIYDAAGQLVDVLKEGICEPGYYQLVWDRRDNTGIRLPSGVYFLRGQADDFTSTEKLVILK